MAGEVVEEGSLAHVRGLGNVLNRDVGKAARGDQLKGAAEQADARLGGAPLAAAHICGSEWSRVGCGAGAREI